MKNRGGNIKRNQEGIVRPIDFFFIGLFFVLVLGGVMYFFRSNPTDDPAGQQMQVELQPHIESEHSQKVYSSSVHGLSLLYPLGWQNEILAEQPIANVLHAVEFRPQEALSATQSVQVYVLEGDNADEAVNESGLLGTGDTLAYNEVLFDGKIGYTYAFESEEKTTTATLMQHIDSKKWILVVHRKDEIEENNETSDAYILIQESIRSFQTTSSAQ